MNQHIVVAVVVIAGVTLWHHQVFKSVETDSKATFTNISVGAFLFLGVLALVDMAPGLDQIASGLAMLAMLTVLLADLPTLLQTLDWSEPNLPVKGPH